MEPATLQRSPTFRNVLHNGALARLILGRHVLDGSNVLGRGAAAASNRVDQLVLTERPNLLGHGVALLVVPTHGVGKASVGVAEHKAVSTVAQVCNVLLHVARAQGAVEANGKRLHMGHAVPERLVRLAAQRAAAVVHNGPADHDRDAHTLVGKKVLQSVQGSLGVERVKDGLHEEDVHTAIVQSSRLLIVRGRNLVKRAAAQGRVLHRGRHTQSLVGGANGACDKLGTRLRVLRHVLCGTLLSQLGSMEVDRIHLILRKTWQRSF
eukprot:363841-Chlamydomonas_euryale.AAC.16